LEEERVRAIVPFAAQAQAAPASAAVLRRHPKPLAKGKGRVADGPLPRDLRGWIDLLGQAGPEGPRPPAPEAEPAGTPHGTPAEALARLRELLERGPGDDPAGALRELVDALAALLAARTLAGGDQAVEVARLHERAAALLAAHTTAGPGRAELEALWAEASALAGRPPGAGQPFWRRRPR
jgi:hypothetical protein